MGTSLEVYIFLSVCRHRGNIGGVIIITFSNIDICIIYCDNLKFLSFHLNDYARYKLTGFH